MNTLDDFAALVNLKHPNWIWYLCHKLWWKFVPGCVVTLRVDSDSSLDLTEQVFARRQWLEDHVGKQYVTWDWKYYWDYTNDTTTNYLEIKARCDKKRQIMEAYLRWA